MSSVYDIPEVEERVLSTLNKDGSRRWLRPRLSPGKFLIWRRIIGYLLIIVFVALPYLKINGKPPILLDIPNREFTFFGATFLPTDTLLLALLILSIFISIFLITALLGRVWCGWGCPQTVYMELVYRPIERLFAGRSYHSAKTSIPPLRQAAKYLVFFIISVFLAHTFLAYFVGAETLLGWMQRSPIEYPTAFIVVAITTILMMLDFCLFREQVCTLMCPYGRFQSVLLDRQSLIISYDSKRGEPRGKKRKEENLGDCVDCSLCVLTCPTGIDIRNGLQMECVGCAQCIDACNSIMRKLSKPLGLIRYSSQEAMESGKRRFLRPRVVIYPVILCVVLVLFGVVLVNTGTADVSFLRNRANPYTLSDDGNVTNLVLISVRNRTTESRSYDISVVEDAKVSSVDLPLILESNQSGSATLHVTIPRHRFSSGRAEINVRITDDDTFDKTYTHRMIGPLFGGADSPSSEESPGGSGS